MKRNLTQAPCVLPFFLPAEPGQRFCLFHRPAPGQAVRGAVLYVHPFAEEMNKTRRMAALQARAFAAQGYGVLQIDLYGCGDSSGDFRDARWSIWKQDLALACDWLSQTMAAPISLWGLRLGALLALDFCIDAQQSVERLILWQPVIHGKSHMNQFMRMRIASQMLADAGHFDAIGATSATNATLRAQLATGASIEVGGYELAAELAAAIDSQDASARAPHCPAHWFELVATAGTDIAPATARHAQRWRDAGACVHLHPICGVPFWASTEIAECRAMLAATTTLCA
jgi:exosortase A-associated hydrolase 2